jgi:hypothetical protein
MAILRERTVWRKSRPANEVRRSTDLTTQEQANARAALRFLAKRLGDTSKLAKAMGAHRETVQRPVRGGVVTAGIALRAARVAGVPLEDVLSGAWPEAGSCPHCGRLG